MAADAEDAAAQRLEELPWSWSPTDVERGLGAVKRRIQRRRRARVALGATASLGLVAVGALLLGRHLGVTPTGGGDGSSVAVLGDGSTIRAAAGARVVTHEVAPQRVRVGLEAGRAAFAVARRPEREFVVEAGAVRVTVLGTRFSIERVGGSRARVHVDEGHVRVAWTGAAGAPDERRDLFAGGEGTFPDGVTAAPAAPAPVEAPRPDPTTTAAPAAPPPAASSSASSSGSSARPRGDHARAGARGWRRLAREGGYREAYDLIVAEGPDGVRDDVDDLLLAADAARLSGHPARALPYLDRVVDRHAPDDRAPMAAFTRGRIFMTLARPGEAAASFERALALGARGSLHENALARAVEAHAKAGDAAHAAALARTYAARYPGGRWLTAVRAYGGID